MAFFSRSFVLDTATNFIKVNDDTIVYEKMGVPLPRLVSLAGSVSVRRPAHMLACAVNIKAMTAINNASWFHMTYAVYLWGNANGGVTSV